MRKTVRPLSLCLMLSLLLSLAACKSGDAPDLAARVREHYGAETALSLTANLRTDFGDRVADFTISYEDTDKGAVLTVLAPESIQGIKAQVGDDGLSLSYKDTILPMGALPATGYSPMETIPFMLRQWEQGYAVQTGFELLDSRQALLIVYKSTQSGVTLEQKALFDPETLAPIHCELSADGVTIVQCDFT